MLYSKLKTLTFLVGLLGAAGIASAAPCAIGSLQSYTALGAGGCNIGTVQFTNFSLLPEVFTPISPSSVVLTPTPFAGFTVGLNATANAGQTLESTFSFVASGAYFNAGFVGLGGSSVTVDGANTASASFTPGGTAIAFDLGIDSQLTDRTSLPGPSSVLVEVDYVVDGGLGGQASLQQGSVGLTIPEPSSMLLMFSALAGLAFMGQRRIPSFFRRQQ